MKETLEEWLDELEEDPIPSSEKKALMVKLQLLLYKEKAIRTEHGSTTSLSVKLQPPNLPPSGQ